MDPAKMKVVDLRSELGTLGLDTKGNKPVLVERLRKAREAKNINLHQEMSIQSSTTQNAELSELPKEVPASGVKRRPGDHSTGNKAYNEDLPKIDEVITTRDNLIIDENPIIVREPVLVEEPIMNYESIINEQPVINYESVINEEPIINKDIMYDETGIVNNESIINDDSIEGEQSQSLPSTFALDTIDTEAEPEPVQSTKGYELYSIDDEQSLSSTDDKSDENNQIIVQCYEKSEDDKIGTVADNQSDDEREKQKEGPEVEECSRRLTEEEEWELMNARLAEKHIERVEREIRQAQEDAQRLEESRDQPVQFERLQKKYKRKQRWSNFYTTVNVTNAALSTPEVEVGHNKKQAADSQCTEPVLEDDKITLSWYDSDLNQYLELPELNSVVPLSEGAFALAWAGARATHGVVVGRVCYEVRVGIAVTTTDTSDKETITNGLRIGWSTGDSSLHLGEEQLSWAYESSGRAVNNGKFVEYGSIFSNKDVVGVYLDLQSNPCKISYTLNALDLGTAFEFEKESLEGKALFPHVLTKNMCYHVNMGYNRYNLLSRTKITRTRTETPVEEVLEEVRRKQVEIRRLQEQEAKRERERRERDRKEREERQRKKREEKDKAEKERKEKEAQENKEKNAAANKDKSEAIEADPQEEESMLIEEVETVTEPPKENGEKSVPEVGTTSELMEVEEQVATAAKDDGDSAGDVEIAELDVSGHGLDERVKTITRYRLTEELDGAEACLLPGYILISHADLVKGARSPASNADCQVILMVGMPGSGKTYWAKKHCAENPELRFNIISTGALFDHMKVDCVPFRSSYEGKWDAMVTKCAKSVVKLLEIAKDRRRNYIIDQTNVYPSAQRRKLREFDGYRRIVVVVVVDEETQRTRAATREAADGKEVPDPAIMDMKANFSLPDPSSPWLDEVQYAELPEAAAKAVVEGYHREAAAAGAMKERDKRSRSESRDAPPAKRARSNDRPNRDYRRQRDREDRWVGGSGVGCSRWGPAGQGGLGGIGGQGGRGGRWGGRDRGGGMGPGSSPRFDRSWTPQQPSRNDFNRDRGDGFRGGRGPGGLGGPRQDRGPGGPGGSTQSRGPPGGDRYQRDNRSQNRGPPQHHNDNKRPVGPMQGHGSGSDGPGNSGQRGPDRFQRDHRAHNRDDGNQRQGGLPQGGNQGGLAGSGSNQGSGSWQRGSQMMTRPSRPVQMHNRQDSGNQNQNQNQQGWNQWPGGWGGWGNNWSSPNQSWGAWNNWNWGNAQPTGNNSYQNSGGRQSQQSQQHWSSQYTAQQWYQWQQWHQQQQQHGWSGYQQGGQQQPSQTSGSQQSSMPATNAADAAQAWAQYYQNYGGPSTNAVSSGDAASSSNADSSSHPLTRQD